MTLTPLMTDNTNTLLLLWCVCLCCFAFFSLCVEMTVAQQLSQSFEAKAERHPASKSVKELEVRVKVFDMNRF